MRNIALLICVIATPTSTANAQSVLAPNAELQRISADFGLADGPAWDGNWALYIPDVKSQKLFRYLPKTKQMTTLLPESGRISASFFNHGKLYLADNGNAQISWLDGKTKQRINGQDTDANPPARPNDLVVDNAGGIYYTLTRQNQVVYIDANGKQSVVVDDINTPNGLTLSPDEKTLYVASFVPKEIWAYELPKRGVAFNGREFAGMDSGPEKGADGMAIDRAGNVYCAGPSDIWVWNPDGKLIDKIACPTKPINCTFGGQRMRTLFITGFGGLYSIETRICGRSPHPPSTAALQPKGPANKPTTEIPDSIEAHLDVPFVTYPGVGDGEAPRTMLCDILFPMGLPGPLPTVVIVHGGGWLNGDKTKFRALGIKLAQRGYATAAIEYRLGGEAHFPAAIHDCFAAVRFLKAESARYKVDPSRIAVVGGSAGAHLAGLMATGAENRRLTGTVGNIEYSNRVRAAVVMAGPMQMTTGSVAERSRTNPDSSNSNRWLGKTIGEAPELYKLSAPYQHINKDSPPILFMAGEFDKPERNEPSRVKLRAAGVWTDVKSYKDGKHGCWNQLPWTDTMVADMDSFLQQHLRK